MANPEKYSIKTLTDSLEKIYGKDLEVHGFSKNRLLMRIKDTYVLKIMFSDGTESPGGRKFDTLEDAFKEWKQETKEVKYESEELLSVKTTNNNKETTC